MNPGTQEPSAQELVYQPLKRSLGGPSFVNSRATHGTPMGPLGIPWDPSSIIQALEGTALASPELDFATLVDHEPAPRPPRLKAQRRPPGNGKCLAVTCW